METYFEAKPHLVKESAIALGFFDGVHPGHQAVIGKAKAEAIRLGVPCGVVTFKDHPRTLTRGQSPLLLTVIDQRLALFEQLGVDVALVLQFTEELCRLSPTEYVQSFLVETMGARSISVGPNHHFGRDREGNAELLARLGKDRDFDVHVAEMVKVEGHEVSSSAIRDLIMATDLKRATLLLSRPYRLAGRVVHGDQRGRTIGFPTANLSVYQYQLIPPRGVYVGRAKLDKQMVPCVINVGFRPTFKSKPDADGSVHPNDVLTVEAHLLDFSEDLYDRDIEVEFLSFLRSEQEFDGIDALKEQIKKDVIKGKSYLAEHGYESQKESRKIEPDKLHA